MAPNTALTCSHLTQQAIEERSAPADEAGAATATLAVAPKSLPRLVSIQHIYILYSHGRYIYSIALQLQARAQSTDAPH